MNVGQFWATVAVAVVCIAVVVVGILVVRWDNAASEREDARDRAQMRQANRACLPTHPTNIKAEHTWSSVWWKVTCPDGTVRLIER